MEPNELRNLTKYRKNSIFPFILFALNVNALSEGGRFPVSLLLSHIELEIDLWSRTTSYVSSSFTKRKFSSGEEMRPGNNRKDFRKRYVRGSVDTPAQTNFHCTQPFVSRKIILSTRGNYLFKMFTTETNVFFFFNIKIVYNSFNFQHTVPFHFFKITVSLEFVISMLL